MARPVITYERGKTYVTDAAKGTSYGLVGTLYVGGHTFDTIERYDPTSVPDFVHLPAQDFPRAVMYWHSEKSRIIHPWAGEMRKQGKQKQENIFVHKASVPSNLEGCIGVGRLKKAGGANILDESAASLETIWKLVGGAPGNKDGWVASSPRVTLRVVNAFPDRTTLKPHSG